MTVLSKNSIYRFVIDIFLPSRCPVCDNVIRWDKLICEECEKGLALCEGGSAAVELAQKTYALLSYEGKNVDLIYALKHSGAMSNFAQYCALKLSEMIRTDSLEDKIDLVTAVPMYIKKQRERGCNQAEAIAKYAAQSLKKPVNFKLLKHSSDKTEQHFLNEQERSLHAQRIYSINDKHIDISGKTILICDDVITTGSTMNACARLLLEMGAKNVICCAAATTTLKRRSE